ncbi:MAG: tsaD [Phycisphaerales bacterium]|nr:tsaD [Phycisphaerales bacterium]
MRILAIESTCDETAAAVVEDGTRVLSNVVATQIDLHQIYRGVVPEIASRAHIEQILPVLQSALAEAACDIASLDAIAVAQRPGLIGSLLIGVTAAKTLAWATGKPLIGVDHVHAHLYSVMLNDAPPPVFPAIGLVASGGHTAMYLIRDWLNITRIGGTIDDAVGEAYDKVAAILGLPYPGGRPIDELAAEGNPKAVHFPRSMLEPGSLNFSFSGLKTSVLYHVRGHKGRERMDAVSQVELRDVCASFQAACIDVLLKKLRRAIDRFGAASVIVGGGVSANRGLRAALPSLGLPVHVPPPAYCTDNAAMIGGLAHVLLTAGRVSELSMDAVTFSALVPSPGTPGEGRGSA